MREANDFDCLVQNATDFHPEKHLALQNVIISEQASLLIWEHSDQLDVAQGMQDLTSHPILWGRFLSKTYPMLVLVEGTSNFDQSWYSAEHHKVLRLW